MLLIMTEMDKTAETMIRGTKLVLTVDEQSTSLAVYYSLLFEII